MFLKKSGAQSLLIGPVQATSIIFHLEYFLCTAVVAKGIIARCLPKQSVSYFQAIYLFITQIRFGIISKMAFFILTKCGDASSYVTILY